MTIHMTITREYVRFTDGRVATVPVHVLGGYGDRQSAYIIRNGLTVRVRRVSVCRGPEGSPRWEELTR
jgi:hypothetical protein